MRVSLLGFLRAFADEPLIQEVVPVDAEREKLLNEREEAFLSYMSGVLHIKENRDEEREKNLKEMIRRARASLASHEKKARRNTQGPRRSLLRKISSKRTTLIRLEGTLELLSQGRLSDLAKDELRTKYRAMCAVPRVLEVFIEPPRLVCITDVLFGKDSKDRWRRIGPMRFTFDLSGQEGPKFRWQNLEGTRNNHHAPPNIKLDGSAGCMGVLADKVINEAVAKKDYATLVEVGVRYPECKGQQVVIEHWPVVNASDVPRWYIETFDRR